MSLDCHAKGGGMPVLMPCACFMRSHGPWDLLQWVVLSSARLLDSITLSLVATEVSSLMVLPCYIPFDLLVLMPVLKLTLALILVIRGVSL